jgi:hypothetical protein
LGKIVQNNVAFPPLERDASKPATAPKINVIMQKDVKYVVRKRDLSNIT